MRRRLFPKEATLACCWDNEKDARMRWGGPSGVRIDYAPPAIGLQRLAKREALSSLRQQHRGSALPAIINTSLRQPFPCAPGLELRNRIVVLCYELAELILDSILACVKLLYAFYCVSLYISVSLSVYTLSMVDLAVF